MPAGRRRPRASPLHRLLDGYFRQFEQVYDERYQKRYGFWRPVIARTVEKFLACGDLREGFARVRCPRCRHEFLVAFSCPSRLSRTLDGTKTCGWCVRTDVLDLVELLLCFGQPAVPGYGDDDLYTDGMVNVLDLIDVLLAFGQSCP